VNIDSDTCTPTFDFYINFPVAVCFEPGVEVEILPQLEGNFQSGINLGGNPGEFSVNVESDSSNGFCEPTFVFKVRFPCPDISFGSTMLFMGTPSAFFDILGGRTVEIDGSSAIDNCNYKFRFVIGIPCPSFSESYSISFVDPEDDPTLTFDIELLAPGQDDPDGAACSYLATLFIGIPGWPDPGSEVSTSSDLACCTSFYAVDGDTLELKLGNDDDDDVGYHLEFNMKKIILPIVSTSQVGESNSMLGCPWVFTAVTNIETNFQSPDGYCLPCATTINWDITNFSLSFPSPGANISTGSIGDCCTLYPLVKADSLKLSLNADSCGYHLEYSFVQLSIPRWSFVSSSSQSILMCTSSTFKTVVNAVMRDDDTCVMHTGAKCAKILDLYFADVVFNGLTTSISLLCEASCGISSMSICFMTNKYQTLYFTNGLLCSVGACVAPT
jgi:hypothetical protein